MLLAVFHVDAVKLVTFVVEFDRSSDRTRENVSRPRPEHSCVMIAHYT
jgi:hypothetical protein